jgi:hypothetical protein
MLGSYSFLTYFEDEEEKERRSEEGGVHLQNLLWIMVKIPKLHPSNPRNFSPGTLITCHLTFIHSFIPITSSTTKELSTYLPTYLQKTVTYLPTTTTTTTVYYVLTYIN